MAWLLVWVGGLSEAFNERLIMNGRTSMIDLIALIEVRERKVWMLVADTNIWYFQALNCIL